MISLKSQAIQTALIGDWGKAITLNCRLLKSNPQDIETLNRLAYAYTSIGKIKNARNTYKKVLELDTKNPIALKNIERLSSHNSNTTEHAVKAGTYKNNMFLEEDGKTKVVELVNIADPKLILQLYTGEHLFLQIKRLKIFVLDANRQYMGMLPDDIAKRLIRFLNGGNAYEAYVKSVANHKLSIFVKETKRATKFKNQPSFLSIKTKAILSGVKDYRFSKSKEESRDED